MIYFEWYWLAASQCGIAAASYLSWRLTNAYWARIVDEAKRYWCQAENDKRHAQSMLSRAEAERDRLQLCLQQYATPTNWGYSLADLRDRWEPIEHGYAQACKALGHPLEKDEGG